MHSWLERSKKYCTLNYSAKKVINYDHEKREIVIISIEVSLTNLITMYWIISLDFWTTVTVLPQHRHLAGPQLKANKAWNESLYSLLRKRVSLVLPCWRIAGTISYIPFCTASAICYMMSIRFNSSIGKMLKPKVKCIEEVQLNCQLKPKEEGAFISTKERCIWRIFFHTPFYKI